MQKINKISLACLCSLFFALCSCGSDGECRQTAAVSLGVDFYETRFDVTEDQFVPSILNDTLTIFGLDNDSLLANEELKRDIRLPLKQFSEQTTYIFERKHLLPDTITFFYENEENFISLECGCLIFHRIIDIEHTFYNIDSVVVTNNFAADEQTKNIRIYFKNR